MRVFLSGGPGVLHVYRPGPVLAAGGGGSRPTPRTGLGTQRVEPRSGRWPASVTGGSRNTGAVALADVLAAVHAAAIVLLLVGTFLALRWGWVLRLHVPVSLSILGVNLAGWSCPLTDLEKIVRQRAGGSSYSGGFLDHYLLTPLGVEESATATQLGIYAVAVLPNLIGCCLLARRARARSVS